LKIQKAEERENKR